VVCSLFLTTGTIQSQCSDAGVCSIGHRSSQQQVQVGMDYAFGMSSKADDLKFHSVIASVLVPVFEDSRLTLSLPYSRQRGPLGSASGIGDLTAIWTQTVFSGTDFRFNVNVGTKIALANVNSGGLPQSYQSGLGTNDVLAGISYETGEWNFSFGYQLSQGRSDNVFSRLKRGDDLLFTVGYEMPVGEFTAAGEVLAIKRIHTSNVLVPLAAQPLPLYIDIPGSDQTQINLVGRLSYPLTESIRTRGMIAVPMLKRDVNIDGLTRSISLSIGLVHTL